MKTMVQSFTALKLWGYVSRHADFKDGPNLIVGPNGSGKSIIANTIAALLNPALRDRILTNQTFNLMVVRFVRWGTGDHFDYIAKEYHDLDLIGKLDAWRGDDTASLLDEYGYDDGVTHKNAVETAITQAVAMVESSTSKMPVDPNFPNRIGYTHQWLGDGSRNLIRLAGGLDGKAINIIDLPEVSLHIGRHAKVAEWIRSLTRQSICITHSPEVASQDVTMFDINEDKNYGDKYRTVARRWHYVDTTNIDGERINAVLEAVGEKQLRI